MSGAGIAAAVLMSLGQPGRVLAQSREPDLIREFREASQKHKVPMGLLMAMGYVNTRWEMPPPEASEYKRGSPHSWGGYGIMALVQNPSTNTLGEASRLTGIPEDELKTDRKSNIMGGAALLAASQGRNRPRSPGEWFGALNGRGGGPGGKEVRATAGVGGGDLYAEQVFGSLRKGAALTNSRGERLSLPAQAVSLPQGVQETVPVEGEE